MEKNEKKKKNIFLRIGSGIKNIFKKKEKPEARFTREWSEVLTEYADVFNGLYAGLKRAADGQMKKKKASVLNEWRLRAHYRWEGESIDEITAACLEPLTDDSEDAEIIKWAKLLMEAVENAGIICDTEESLILDENSVNAYADWNGGELYPDDSINIMSPAWYQDERVIEKGYCTKAEEE